MGMNGGHHPLVHLLDRAGPVDDGGIDDRIVKDSVEGLTALPDVAVFVVPAKQISRYAAITLGADVQQVPALLVMKPPSAPMSSSWMRFRKRPDSAPWMMRWS